MDFLIRYRAKINYRKKKIKFHLDDGKKFTFIEVLSLMINNIKARQLLNKGCMDYLAYVMGKTV